MPTKVRGRPTGIAVTGGLLAAGGPDKRMEPPKGVPFPPLGVSKTALLSPDIIMGG